LCWADVSDLLDQPLGVVLGDEAADGIAHVIDRLVDPAMDDLLLEGAEEALDDAIGFGLADKGVTWRDAPGADLLLEVIGHEVAAVVVAQRQAAGGAG